jgi:anti-anti-sigma factor
MGSQKSKAIITREDTFLRVTFPNSVGIDDSGDLQSDIESYLLSENDKLVIDFSDTTALYSPGFSLLIRLNKLVTESGGTMHLVNVSQKLRDIFTGLNLERIFSIYATDVEFEMSQQDKWEEGLSGDGTSFIFIPTLENGVYRITVAGQMTSLQDLSPVKEFPPETDCKKYIVNVKDLDLLDTYGAQVLNELASSLHSNGSTCVICGASPIVRDLLEIFPSGTTLAFYETEKEALESFKK